VINVPNVADGLSQNRVMIDSGFGGNFASDHDQVTLGVRFASNPTSRVLGQAGVENCVRYGIADLVRMALANRLRGEDVIFAHASLALRDHHINVSRYEDISPEIFGQ